VEPSAEDAVPKEQRDENQEFAFQYDENMYGEPPIAQVLA
jgi:hypothetical protein